MWWKKLVQIWKIKDLRQSIVFVAAMLAIFRIAAHIPIPGIDAKALKDFFSANQLLGIMNILSGGGMENFSIVAMGVAPYITASIIFQLLIMIIPRLEEISKEGEAGQRRINQWTRMLTIPLAAMQGYGLVALLRQSSAQIFLDLTPWRLLMIIVTSTAGTIFLMWLGELISEKHVGNGISLLIFAGIVSGLPQALQQTFLVFDNTQLINLLLFVFIAILTIVGVVIITEGQRNVPVSYAKRVRGMKMYGGVNTHLPLRVNMAGVIPIIFAISIILFPPMIAQFFLTAKTQILVSLAEKTIALFQNQIFYGVLYFLLVFAFTYFYTEVIFHPDQIAENLQKQGGFIPGIRPGHQTVDYLKNTTNRIILAGALFLGIISVLPLALRSFTGITTLAVGGTSLLIVVSVVIETYKKIESQLTMRDYEGL
ncbi:MAG: preprotein translocase subunit SecY [Candidatus Buchananbacteria bacterium RIFCSPHIGHO2_01_FULL_39_14]|uniref:Protein translocase subunit SecY n=2 Tax=Candidatus Buchananiibacteriota TaxID=1817903 RepID=A0A1G1YMQ6_9BACT|nr:MAG: preprotein translocase subunit SecY [Candidatus Buchananbacteria bacterium RIFCSPHIGHO2_01_FULL_39_14]OGY49321.1 MAG: preprotein translocase subunit SecY [Candidatus Buchananbacteria bacterium RIFCSPHIGHO2_02_FULL_39_17]OGY53642.1 MAG: preprotein translocase subunit SecY [Candidatus Buchananbacteria bacterium RIFCSPLOWO2_01_FULL_40_23b]